MAVRVTAAEHAALNARAAQAGLSLGAYLRAIALGSPGPRAVRKPTVELTELARTLGLLGKYGSNLNQLTHAANAAGQLPTALELDQLRDEVKDLRVALMRALGRGD